MLNLENMETEKLYVAPSNEDLDNLAWTPDGQSLVFDIHENYFLTAFQKLVILTGKLQSISVPENTLPKYFGAEHLEIDQNNDYIIEGSGGYIASPDLKNFRMFTPNTVEDLGGFFLTPDRKEITTFCGQAALCNYNIDTNKLTEAYNGKLTSECCAVTDGNWSYDEKDVVYLVSGGESDPQYIILLDTQTKQNYTIYKFYYKAIELGPVDVRQLTWYSAK